MATTTPDATRGRLPAPGDLLRSGRDAARRLRPLLRGLAAPVRLVAWRVGGFVTPAGRVVVVGTVAAWAGAYRLGWVELAWVASAGITALTLAGLLTTGRLRLTVAVDVDPVRVVAAPGGGSRAEVVVANPSRRRALSCLVEVTVGERVASFLTPQLEAGASYDTIVDLPAERRGVVEVGPARTVRRDPLALLQRSVAWPVGATLYVHPRTLPPESLGAGLLRDLEGRTTNDVSTSDVELHTLREYEPGDDRRHVHWRTSARTVDGRLMVRQYVDTRRSHVLVVLAGAAAGYASEDEFEVAVSVAGSLGLRAVRDQQTVSLVADGRPVPSESGARLLDGLAGVMFDAPGAGLLDQVTRCRRVAPDATAVMFVHGARTGIDEVKAAALRFSPDVKVVALRVDLGATPSVRPFGPLSLLTVGALEHVPRVFVAAART